MDGVLHEWTEMYYGKIKAMKLSEDLKYTLDEEPIVIVDLERDKLPWIHKMSDPRVGKEGYLTDAHIYGNFRPAYCL